ncbi:MAG: phosphate/phosphite/phosphonate ABC transporter substrate-binding protein [Gammaproteobacteria bacterium]|jgi:phosphonate transport system substrate-binding protein
MMKVKSIIPALIVFSALSWIPSVVLADLTMGIFPRRPPAVTQQAFQPLADYLSQKLGQKVKLEVPKDFSEFWNNLKQNKYDLVHLNQYHYIRSHKEEGYKVIVSNKEFGSGQIAGALSVRKDSGVNSVADLRGKTILFGGGKKAMGSYIAPTAILKKAGLEAGRDYKVAFSKNPPSAVIGVYNKAAAASGSGNVILKIKGVTKRIDSRQMKILAESEPFTQLSWAVKGDMSDDLASKIQDAMVTLDQSAEGKKVLKAARVDDFIPVSDSDYDKVREITKFAIGEEY